MKRFVIILFISCLSVAAYSQTNTFPASGNVGIGTTTPYAGLHLTNTYNYNNNLIAAIFGNAYNHWTCFGGLTAGRIRGSNEGYLSIESNPNGTGDKKLYLNASSSENVIIANGGGNVGIGTNNPLAKFEVKSSNAIYTAAPTLLVKDITNRGTLFLESVVDQPTDFVFKNNNRFSWSMSTRNSAESYALQFYYSVNGTSWYQPAITFLTNGKVGIGTTTPGAMFQIGSYFQIDGNEHYLGRLGFNRNINTGSILNSSYGAYQIHNNDGTLCFQVYNSSGTHITSHFMDVNGNFGVGTTPSTKLDVKGGIRFGGNSNYNLLTSNSIYCYIGQTNTGLENPETNSAYFFGINPRMGTDRTLVVEARTADGSGSILFKAGSGSYSTGAPECMRIVGSNGNVGIGTTNPLYKLSVKGTIGCGEVKVEVVTGWADFVFKPSYKLRSLGEVEQFIKTNNHLPEIPTEAEVKENGVGLGEMNAKLLQKVEELTLYMIEQQKRIDEFEKQTQRINELEKKLEKIISNQ